MRASILLEPDEDGAWIATVLDMPGVVEQGETPEEALARLKEAIAFTVWADGK